MLAVFCWCCTRGRKWGARKRSGVVTSTFRWAQTQTRWTRVVVPVRLYQSSAFHSIAASSSVVSLLLSARINKGDCPLALAVRALVVSDARRER